MADAAEAERQAALKRKGEAYFNAVLTGAAPGPKAPDAGAASALQASAPAIASARTARPERAPRVRRPRAERVDEDLNEMGSLVERSKLWIAALVFGLCTCLGAVLMKASLHALPAPAFVLSFHMLPLAGVMHWAASHGFVEGSSIAQRQVLAAAPGAALHALEGLCMYGALTHASVTTVVVWMAATTTGVDVALDFFAGGRAREALPPKTRLYTLAAAGVLALIQFLCELGQARMISVLWLVLYTAVCFSKAAYGALKEMGAAAPGLVGEQAAALVSKVALVEGGEDISPGGRLMFNNLLPVGPLVVLGLVFGEGGEFVDHELSVPVVTTILVSCVMAVGLGCAGLTVYEQFKPEHLAMLLAGAQLGTIAMDSLVRVTAAPVLGVIGGVGAVILMGLAKLLEQIEDEQGVV